MDGVDRNHAPIHDGNDLADPVERHLFNVLAVVAECEADPIQSLTRDGRAGCGGEGPRTPRPRKRTSP